MTSGAASYALVVSRTWILQSNPKLYDVDAAVHTLKVIYWRIPQYTGEVHAGDRALLWRSGKEAGLVGWGRFLSDPLNYDISEDDDPFMRGLKQAEAELYAPIRVWPARRVAKAEVAAALPAHQIVIAPMGTVFRLDTDDLDTIQPLLSSYGYELDTPADGPHSLLPVLPAPTAKPKPVPGPAPAHARITPALFLLSSAPERPTEITIEGDALRLQLVEREALGALDESWDSAGIYLLLGKPSTDQTVLTVYVGKAQGLRSRIKTGHQPKQWWTRCLLIQRPGLHPFNASDISWLERRLIDVLLEASEIDLENKTPPPVEVVPEYKSQILERTVVAALGVLGVLGAYVA